MQNLTVAISPCPNDTWIFGAWILGLVGHEPPDAGFAFLDVETLNRAAMRGEFDVVKVSSAAALDLGKTYRILPSGAAFGLGAGPKLVAAKDFSGPVKTIAVPGVRTTALAVTRAALADPGAQAGPLLPSRDAELLPMRYDAIVPAIQAGRVDAGLLIHETALVFETHGLKKILDLGEWWAAHTSGSPLPLGCIIAKKALGRDMLEDIADRIRRSIQAARENPEAVMPLIRSLAQEFDEDTLARHIETYVNDMSVEMGATGAKALTELDILMRNDREWRDCRLPAFDESW
jgi:1,4-dihydroxy-6-naphthoate synthase